MARITPIKQSCYVCGAPAMLMPPVADGDDYDCPDCGSYRISGTALLAFPS